MKIDEIFKKMKNVGLGSEKKRNPTRPEVKEIKKFPEKTAVQMKHRYGPEDRPLPLSAIGGCGEIPPAQERTPLAFCPHCNAERQMKWKAPDERGKNVESWFVCATCGYDKLEIKRLNTEGK